MTTTTRRRAVGTSSAASVVSGVVALMLQANPNLTWRDVQHILVNSARHVDPTDAGWTTNRAGHLIHYNYGFGVVDAEAAVNLAKTWTNVGPELSVSSGLVTVGEVIPDNDSTGVSSTRLRYRRDQDREDRGRPERHAHIPGRFASRADVAVGY